MALKVEEIAKRGSSDALYFSKAFVWDIMCPIDVTELVNKTSDRGCPGVQIYFR
jgi:hypothetical protein